MKFAFINNFARLLLEFERLNSISRINDHLFLLELADKSRNYHRFFVDLKPYANNIFITSSNVSLKSYKSPFDVSISRLNNSAIEGVKMDGSNKILILSLSKKDGYKQASFELHFELTNRYTNVILTDEKGMIRSALRYLRDNSRQILKDAHLVALPQPREPYKVEEYDREKLILQLKENYERGFYREIDQKRKVALEFVDKKIASLMHSKNALDSHIDLMQKALEMRAVADALMLNRESFVAYQSTQSFNGANIILHREFSSVNEAIEHFYAKSKRLKKKAAGIGTEISFIDSRIDALSRQRRLLQDTMSPDDLEIFGVRNLKKQDLDKKIGLFIQGYKFSIGRNERENQALLESARANDIWMHARDIPSSHGIIHCGKNTPSIEVIAKAANLLAGLNSKSKISVDYTLRKFVKLKGGAQVHYSKHKTLHCN